jgi:hypothetical protein
MIRHGRCDLTPRAPKAPRDPNIPAGDNHMRALRLAYSAHKCDNIKLIH